MIKPEPIRFAEAERLSQIFDADNREEWQRTSAILAKLALQPDTVIADVGAGTGYFAQLFAQRVPQGRVYALDTEPNMLAYMARRFADASFSNISVQASEQTNPLLPQGLDVVFLANVYRFIHDRQTFLAQLYQQFGSETRGMFVDLKLEQAQVSPQQAMAEIAAAGFTLVEMDLIACPNHYILQFMKRAAS